MSSKSQVPKEGEMEEERRVKIERILKAYRYNARARNRASCNQLYMGSMATAALFRALGGDWPKENLGAVLKRATDAQLEAGLERCASILKYAERETHNVKQ